MNKRQQSGHPSPMQLPLAPQVAIVALLSPMSTIDPPTTVAEPVTQAAVDGAAPDALPPASPCPAYEGPQCDSQAHEQYLTGQDLVDIAGLPIPPAPALRAPGAAAAPE